MEKRGSALRPPLQAIAGFRDNRSKTPCPWQFRFLFQGYVFDGRQECKTQAPEPLPFPTTPKVDQNPGCSLPSAPVFQFDLHMP